MDLVRKAFGACVGAMDSRQAQTELVLEEPYSIKRIQDLPDELLCLVFSFLDLGDLALGAKRVCQRWKAVADDNSLWKTRILSCDTYEPEEALEIMRKSPNLRHVEFPRSALSGFFFKAVAEHCTELRGIKCSSVEYNVHGFKAVTKHCPKLEHVAVSGMIRNPRNFLHLIGKCRNLKGLKVYFRTTETGIFDSITEGCPMLQSLDVMCCEYRRRDLSRFLERMGHQLTDLHYECCLNDADRHCVLPDIVRYCRRLEVLHIRDHKGSVQSLNAFFECGNARNLRDLSLVLFQTNDLLSAFAFHHTPNLTSLDISLEISNKHLEAIGKLSHLTVLQLESLIGPSDEAVKNIVRCKKLKKLCLDNFKGTDENFATFCKELPNLEILWIAKTTVTAKSLLLVPDHLRNLRRLLVRGQDLEEAVLLIKCRMPFLDIRVSRY